jgi:hypothetical protein
VVREFEPEPAQIQPPVTEALIALNLMAETVFNPATRKLVFATVEFPAERVT